MRLLTLTQDSHWLWRAEISQLAPLVADAEREMAHKAGTAVASKAMRLVMAAYRTPDLVDPVKFVDCAVQAIEDFPAIVVARLASPKTGIVRECKFPPTIAELVKWCESAEAPMKGSIESACRQIERQRSAAESARIQIEQAAERARQKAEWDAAAPERERLAEEAQKLAERAVNARAREEAIKRRRDTARANWTKAFFGALNGQPDEVLERAFALGDDEQEQATEVELKAPGTGHVGLLKKVNEPQEAAE